MRRNINNSKPSKGVKTPMAANKNSKRDSFSKGELSSKGRDNDPNWYFTNAELASQASELSFQSFIGELDIPGAYNVPAVNTVWLNPCPGNSYGIATDNDQGDYTTALPSSADTPLDSGINLMANKIYTMLSTYSGRTTNYTPEDVGIMLLAVASMAEFSEAIRRAFGVVLTYNERNRAVPRRLIEAMGINWDNLISNLPLYRMRFNTILNRINQIPLLDNIGFIRKSRDLYQRIYLDAPSSMAQILMYMPFSLWILDETGYAKGLHLKTTRPWPELVPSATAQVQGQPQFDIYADINYKVNMSRLLDYFDAQVSALLESSTLNIIYADLLNLASKINVPVWKFDYLAENYVVTPEFNRNFLLQFHNLDVVGAPIVLNSNAIVKAINGYTFTTDNDVVGDIDSLRVIYNPGMAGVVSQTVDNVAHYVGILPRAGIVDMDTDVPTVEDRIEALRFKSFASGWYVKGLRGTSDYNEAFRALPDHYAVCFCITDGTGKNVIGQHNFFATASASLAAQYLHPLANFTQCDWAPLIYAAQWDVVKSWNPTNDMEYYTDLNFWTEIDWKYLNRLNKMIYSGLFDFRTN